MIQILYQFGVIFIVTLYATINTYTVEGLPCHCSPCQTICSKTIICPPPITCPLQTCPVPSPCPQPPPCPPCLVSIFNDSTSLLHLKSLKFAEKKTFPLLI